MKEIFCPINVYRRTRTKQRERKKETKRKNTEMIFFQNVFFVVTFFVCDHRSCYSEAKENIENDSSLDIHSFEQQMRMITHTHKQTDIKKRRREDDDDEEEEDRA